jgi:hypothetical protein
MNMTQIIKKASAYTSDELAAMGRTGIPNDWPLESYPYNGTDLIPSGFIEISDQDLIALKTNNQSAYDAYLAGLPADQPLQVYAYSSSTSLSTTTSTDWQSRLLLTTLPMVSGEYNISWNYSWYYTSKQRNFQAQVVLDNSTVVHSLVQEPSNASSSQRRGVSGFLPITIEEGIHTIELKFRTSNASDEAGIENVSLELLKKIR